jgi:phosphoadenosine phosphosulfate reductase
MTTRTGAELGQVSDADLDHLDAEFEHASASAIVRWAVESFGDRLCIAASMQDAVLVDIATKVDPRIEVVFIDTGDHFPETLETLERVRSHYALNLRVMRVPTPAVPFYEVDPVKCCSEAKVEQLELALAGKQAWMSGLRRVEAATRANARIVGRDSRGLVKVNPLATWNDDDIAGYIRDHEVIYNPLLDQGYLSIGCAPTTRQVAAGEDPRSGRWGGSDKTECGLHE